MIRTRSLEVAVLAAASMIIIRLIDLQLIHGAHYRRLAENNRLRVVPEEGPRGLIMDRDGTPLARNHTVFRLAIVPQEVDDVDTILERLSRLVDIPASRLRRTWEIQRSLPFVPATVVSRIPKPLALKFEEEHLSLPGVVVRPETVRYYPRGRSAAHLLGYLGRPTPEEVPMLKPYGVRPQHLVGRMGLEHSYDAYLRGKSGGAVVEVDHRTRRQRSVGYRPPEAGESLLLTVDARLQSLIEEGFGEQTGAAVVLDPRTGAVLAMVSRPAFAPEAFVGGRSDEVRAYLNDPAAPLLNRATMGAYTPGSIAKLITASVALERGLVTPSSRIECTGALRIGDRTFHCWNLDGHGSLTLIEAIRSSCNVYFLQLGRRLRAGPLMAGMVKAGWSKATRWMMEERTGFLPRRRLTEGEVAMLAIGQGEILVTPLQAAVMVSALANDGWLVRPWVVRAVGNRTTRRMAVERLGWSSETLKAVRTGMRLAVEHDEGTARRAWTPATTVAGKTGTAQTHVIEKPHGWFVGFCPLDEPSIAIAIVAEHGGSGGDLPALIARTICEYASTSDLDSSLEMRDSSPVTRDPSSGALDDLAMITHESRVTSQEPRIAAIDE